MTKTILGVFATAALLTTGFVFAQQAPPPAQAPGVPGAPAGPRGMRYHRMQRMEQYLGLTDAQKTQIRTIREQARTESQPFVQQLRAGYQEIHKLIQSGATPEQVGTRAEQIAASNCTAIQQLARIKATTAAKMYAVLTPEQRTKAQQMRGRFRHGFGGPADFGALGPEHVK